MVIKKIWIWISTIKASLHLELPDLTNNIYKKWKLMVYPLHKYLYKAPFHWIYHQTMTNFVFWEFKTNSKVSRGICKDRNAVWSSVPPAKGDGNGNEMESSYFILSHFFIFRDIWSLTNVLNDMKFEYEEGASLKVKVSLTYYDLSQGWHGYLWKLSPVVCHPCNLAINIPEG